MGEFLAVCAGLAALSVFALLFWLNILLGKDDKPWNITKSTMIEGRWYCAGNGRVGVGSSPDEAVTDWEKQG